MGSSTDPSRIFKGTIGAGQMGGETRSPSRTSNVVKVDPELNMLVVRGAIPGPKGGLVTIKNTVKIHKVKQAGADISKNPQKASGRNPQKASARNEVRKGVLKECLRLKLSNMTGAEVGTVELNDAIFGIEPNMSVVHEVVKNHLANCRQGTQSALTRAEVSGGGRKPWRQKGTGRARQGSTRSPQWTHGGIVFAPKPRNYSYVLNKKVKRLALKSVLSSKAKDGEIVVVDKIAMDEIKTKSFKNFLTAVNAEGKSVVVTPEVNDIVVKSARNIPGVVTSPAKLINVYDLLNAKTLVIDKDALAVIEEVFA